MKRTFAALLVALSLGLAPAQNTVQLILDASGSMFNSLEDGRYRIVAAKDALANLIGALPASGDLNVGLRVYGSRSNALDDGACVDSELVVPMAGFARDALLDAVRGTQARGATPIAYSLEQAIEDFAGVAGEKLVVLVTDGEESCGGNVREVAERLGAGDIDLRVIGFDLSAAAAASFEGIGAFENARSAQELAAALGRAVAPATESGQEGTFEVAVNVTRAGEPAEGARVTFVSPVTGEAYVFAQTATGALSATVPAGSYRVEVADVLSDEPLTVSSVVVTPEGENTHAYELAPANAVVLSVTSDEPVAGSRVTVAYEGAPGDAQSWITIVPAAAPDEIFLDWAYVDGASGSVELGVPVEAAELEARFHVELPEGGTQVIGRSEPFSSAAAEASVEAPAEIVAGSVFQVAWTGPENAGDYLTIVAADAPQGAYLSYAYTDGGNPAELMAPQQAGAYEVRYVAGQGEEPILARAAVNVVAGSYGVEAPTDVEPGTRFDVSWEGPNNQGDYVTIVPAGAPDGTYLSYAYTSAGNPVQLTAPTEPGAYEVRYATEQHPYPTLASSPITVVAVEYGVEAPATVAPGERFEVSWTGPDAAADYVTIVPAGAPAGEYMSYQYTSAGNPVTLTAPDEPGTYEVRYQSDAADGVFARQEITVE